MPKHIKITRRSALSGLAIATAGLSATGAESREGPTAISQAGMRQGNVPIYSSKVALSALSVPVGITALRVNGHAVAGDGGDATYRKVDSEPSHIWKLQSSDGAWWEVVEGRLDPRMVGVKFDYNPATKIGTDNYAIILSMINSSLPSVSTASGSPDTPPIVWPRGRLYCSDTINIKKWINWSGCFSPEMTAAGTEFYFPKGKTGIVFHAGVTKDSNPVLDSPATTGAFGSILRGILCSATVATISGLMVDYNASIGRMLTWSWTAAPENGQAIEFYSPHSPNPTTAVTGSATVNGTTEVGQRVLRVSDAAGAFAMGETVIASESGATGIIAYIDAAQTGIMVRSISGRMVAGQTLTGGTSGATATLVVNSALGTSFRAVPIGSVTGTIDITVGGDRASIWRERGVASCGIIATTTVSIHDCGATSFSEHGLKVVANGGGYPGSNANRTLVDGFAAFSNGGNGAVVAGTDANVFDFRRIDTRLNAGYGVNDMSFLGGVHAAFHSSNDLAGSFCSINTNARQSVWSGCYSESNNLIPPFRSPRTIIDFPNVVIGGTHGLPIETSSTGKPAIVQAAGRLSTLGFEYDNLNGTAWDGMLTLRRDARAFAPVLNLENVSNWGTGRGVGMYLLGPRKAASALYGAIVSSFDASGTYVGFKAVSSFLGPEVSAAGTTGEGFKGYLEVAAGAVTNLIVLNRGRNYSADTVLTVSGGGGAGATLAAPVISSGGINSATISAGGACYTNQVLTDVFHVYDDEVKPATDVAVSFGSSVLRWLKGWFGNISLFPAASVTPTVNGEVTFQLSSNTSLTIKVKGSDGVVRSGSITLA